MSKDDSKATPATEASSVAATELSIQAVRLEDLAADLVPPEEAPTTEEDGDEDTEEKNWLALAEMTNIQSNKPVVEEELTKQEDLASFVGAPQASAKGPSGTMRLPGFSAEGVLQSKRHWELSEGEDDDSVMVLRAAKEAQLPVASGESSTGHSTRVTTSVNVAELNPQSFAGEHRYELGPVIAKGGMGYVQRVFDRSMLRYVAMKTLKPEVANHQLELKRFLGEAQITGQLEHPHIVPVYDVGVRGDGRYYFTMQLVRGRTLLDVLRDPGYDPSREIVLYRTVQQFLKVCDAVSFAHSRGVLHRDLKPANIMVGGHGEVYLMDWGIAYVLHQKRQDTTVEQPVFLSHGAEQDAMDTPGQAIGSLGYVAPEQARGEMAKIDKRADIFSLGAILYAILTTKPPYQGQSYLDILRQACVADIVPPQERCPFVKLPRGLCAVAMKAMRKNPEDRFQSAHELREAVEYCIYGDGRFPRRRFVAGALIVREGDQGELAYGIVKGRCRAFKVVEGEELVLREMGPGEVFGEAAAILNQPRSASVVALEEVVVVCIHSDKISGSLSGDTTDTTKESASDSWMGRLVQSAAYRFRDIDAKLTKEQQQSKQLGLISAILSLVMRLGAPYEGEAHDAKGAPLRGKLVASWPTFSQALLEKTGLLVDELSAALAQSGAASWDREGEQIFLDKEKLLAWLAAGSGGWID